MPDQHVLAIDQGTSATKCLLVDRGGTVIAQASEPVDCKFPRPGWVEQSPDQIWLSVLRAVSAVTAGRRGRIAAIGLSTQRESALMWDRTTGEPLSPVLSWQDQRTAPAAEKLLAAGHGDLIRERSGLPVDPMFSALKAQWLLAERHGRAGAADAGLALGTIDSYLLARLCSRPGTAADHVIEAGNAARTQLMDVRRRKWDPDLLEVFSVSAAVLPRIVPSAGSFAAATVPGTLSGTPVAAVLGDSHAALYAHTPAPPGTVKATYGTGSSVMALLDGAPASGSVDPGVGLTLAWETDRPAWALEGNIRSAGATMTWLSRLTGAPVRRLAELAGSVERPGIHLVPAFTGLGAPWWTSRASGLIDGLTFGTELPHLARAALESIAFQVADVVASIARSGVRVTTLLADGGASTSDTLMQLQADLCGIPVVRPPQVEFSALGVAQMAAAAAGTADWTPPTATDGEAVFEPRLSEADRADRMGAWHEAVAAARR